MATMHLIRDDIERRCGDREMVERLLELDGKRVVELGCGAAVNTRALAAAGRDRRVLAYEVDQTQHQLNLATPPQPNVEFRYGSAAAIDCADGSVDVVMMLKSLHHVPREALPQALREIHRVLIVAACSTSASRCSRAPSTTSSSFFMTNSGCARRHLARCKMRWRQVYSTLQPKSFISRRRVFETSPNLNSA